MPLRDSLECSPSVLEAIVKVCNKNNKEKEQQYKDAKKSKGENTYPHNTTNSIPLDGKNILDQPPPELNEKSKIKLETKLKESQEWIKKDSVIELINKARNRIFEQEEY